MNVVYFLSEESGTGNEMLLGGGAGRDEVRGG
jgi:hypothetical protein